MPSPPLVQADGWKANPAGHGWKERRLQIDVQSGLFRYLDLADVPLLRTFEDIERLQKGSVKLCNISFAEGKKAVLMPGTATHAPAAWSFRVTIGSRTYRFAFKVLEDYVKMYCCMDLLVRRAQAGIGTKFE